MYNVMIAGTGIGNAREFSTLHWFLCCPLQASWRRLDKLKVPGGYTWCVNVCNDYYRYLLSHWLMSELNLISWSVCLETLSMTDLWMNVSSVWHTVRSVWCRPLLVSSATLWSWVRMDSCLFACSDYVRSGTQRLLMIWKTVMDKNGWENYPQVVVWQNIVVIRLFVSDIVTLPQWYVTWPHEVRTLPDWNNILPLENQY